MTTKAQAKERRRHIRAKRALTIEHRLYKRNGNLVDGIWQFSLTCNMSIAGILFSSEIPYRSGDILQIRVVMSGLDVFRGYGRVVRTEETRSKGNYRIAVSFIDENSRLIKSRSAKKYIS